MTALLYMSHDLFSATSISARPRMFVKCRPMRSGVVPSFVHRGDFPFNKHLDRMERHQPVFSLVQSLISLSGIAIPCDNFVPSHDYSGPEIAQQFAMFPAGTARAKTEDRSKYEEKFHDQVDRYRSCHRHELGVALADNFNSKKPCAGLPSFSELRTALISARQQANGGFNLDMWGTIVNRDGVVCAVAFTGNDRGDQWPGSRVISAQKANTANAFSLPNLVLSTANLYSASAARRKPLWPATQQSCRHLCCLWRRSKSIWPAERSDDGRSYRRRERVRWRTGALRFQSHPAWGPGGERRFFVRRHNIAWRTRHSLQLDYLPGGVSGDPTRPDNIVYDIATLPGQPAGVSANGWGHPACSSTATSISTTLPVKR